MNAPFKLRQTGLW